MTQTSGRRDFGFAPRGLRLEAAHFYCGMGKTKFLELVADGRMPAGKPVDGCVLWDRLALDAALDVLLDAPRAAPEAGSQPPGGAKILTWGAVGR
jgi:hypothetical protein